MKGLIRNFVLFVLCACLIFLLCPAAMAGDGKLKVVATFGTVWTGGGCNVMDEATGSMYEPYKVKKKDSMSQKKIFYFKIPKNKTYTIALYGKMSGGIELTGGMRGLYFKPKLLAKNVQLQMSPAK